MTDDHILDARAEPSVRRHYLIFETFEALEAGANFELVNDHDSHRHPESAAVS